MTFGRNIIYLSSARLLPDIRWFQVAFPWITGNVLLLRGADNRENDWVRLLCFNANGLIKI
jgi:hypothetical protein